MEKGLLKKIVSGVIIFAVVMAGLWFAWNLTTQPANQADENKPVPIEITDKDHTKGATLIGSETKTGNTTEEEVKKQSVVLAEFSDFQCPACRMFVPLVKQLLEEHGENLTLVYKHFPLPQHENAELAAYAAEAAGNQGKFFEMHDKLFETQDEWSAEKDPKKLFEKYATDLKLNVKQFTADFGSAEAKAKIEKDVLEGTQAGVTSTPTFFLNGVKLNNPGSYEEFSMIIESAIAQMEAESQESTPSAGVTQGVTGSERSE